MSAPSGLLAGIDVGGTKVLGIALDPTNVVFAAMEFALLRSRSVKSYLKEGETGIA